MIASHLLSNPSPSTFSDAGSVPAAAAGSGQRVPVSPRTAGSIKAQCGLDGETAAAAQIPVRGLRIPIREVNVSRLRPTC